MSKDTKTQRDITPSTAVENTARMGDGFLTTLADLESRLSALKTLHEQSESMQSTLDGREKALSAREHDLASRLSVLETRQAEFESAAAELRDSRHALEQLKKSVEKTVDESKERAEQRERELAARAGEIERRESDLVDRERQVAARQVKAESSAAEARQTLESAERERLAIAQDQAQVEQRSRTVDEREQALVAEAQRIAAERKAAEDENQQRERALRELEHELGEREIDIKNHADELERERASAVEHARTLAEQMKAGEEESNAAIWANRIESIQLQLGEASAARAKAETERDQSREQIESLTQELLNATQNRGVSAEEFDDLKRHSQAIASQLEQSTAMIQMLQGQVDQAAERERLIDDARQKAEQRVEETEKSRNDRAAQLEAALAEATKRCDHLSEQAKNADRDARAATELLAESERRAPQAMERADKAEREAQDLEKSLSELKSRMSETLAAAASKVAPETLREREQEIERLRTQLHGALSQSGDAGAAMAQTLAARDREIAELRQQLSEAGSGAASREAIEERDRTIAQLREELEHARGDSSPSGASNDEELLKREQAIVLLKERLEQVMSERSELAERVERLQQTGESAVDATSDDADQPTEGDLRRRDRLRKYKTLLQGQARKILAAQNALQRRHAECEQVLSHRAKLAAAAQELAKVERKTTGAKARSGAGAALLYMVATLSVLAIMSWEVSKRVWPGTYIAKTVLEADSGRRTPSPDDLKAWQSDHENLIKDPRLLEVAAERMGRRGLAAYSTAVDLKQKLDGDLYVQSAHPGQITIELRGEGAERSALVLDTFVTTLKSVADQMRDERSNDIGLTIAQTAAAGSEPLLDKRIEKALSVFGGAALAALLAGLAIWSRLVKAKRKFDHAQAVESALHEVDWNALETSLKKPGIERASRDAEAA